MNAAMGAGNHTWQGGIRGIGLARLLGTQGPFEQQNREPNGTENNEQAG